MWDPQHHTTLYASTASYGDSFIFVYFTTNIQLYDCSLFHLYGTANHLCTDTELVTMTQIVLLFHGSLKLVSSFQAFQFLEQTYQVNLHAC
jgi:hypothetical protein